MNLHEYQAKDILQNYGIKVPVGQVVHSVDEAVVAMQKLSANKLVVKAQVYAGGRGKAGGVKIVHNQAELVEVARTLLHNRLVTYQTTEKGQLVNSLLLELPCEITQELYLGAVLDRAARRVVIMASLEGGVDIEQVASKTPEKIFTVTLDPLFNVMPYQCRQLAFSLGLNTQQTKQFANIVTQIGKLFMANDLSLLEINPLVITSQGDLMCLDAKMSIDDNALYRQAELRKLWDQSQEDEREIRAKEWELNYIALTGNIGCMVNGAGLAMATMDLIQLHGGYPANFLDVGGGATQERVAEAFKIILSDGGVKAVLVNIFGGIVRCDLIAEGIISAIKQVEIKIPVVVRLEGNRAKVAHDLLNSSNLNIIAADSLNTAAAQVVAAAGEKI